MAMAIFSFVPTPSALETSTGSRHFLSSANNPPNEPIPPITPRVNVREARRRMRCLAWSASEISTPASA